MRGNKLSLRGQGSSRNAFSQMKSQIRDTLILINGSTDYSKNVESTAMLPF